MARLDPDLTAAIAVTRFGLGARPGEIASARGDPRGFLTGQIRPSGADQPQTNGETSAERIAELRDFRQDKRAVQTAAATPGQPPAADGPDPVKMARRLLRDDTGTDFVGRARLAATTDAGFRERWALFWANHFTVSASKFAVATVAGPFEQEAIRPHVFGRFGDLLSAAETHPAMLLYLDQAQSIGPDSRAAQFLKVSQAGARQRGLNENLAREILELHTVGVNGGYTQADVTEFARAMTGVSIGGSREAPERIGKAVFRDNAHEPGPRTVMGVSYPQEGRDQAASVLADLARKPQTARFLSGKIARHFVSDAPPPALVGRLERAWRDSDGALDHVAATLVSSPEAWDPDARKFKTPYEFLISGWRAAGSAPDDVAQLAPTLNGLGQKPFTPPSPKGWPDDAAAWAAPDAIVKRMTWAQAFAARQVDERDPKALAADALGARLTPAAAAVIARAETRAEGFAVLLMSPEFQYR